MNNGISDYPDVSFIDNLSFETMSDGMIKDYQTKYKEITGRESSLGAADPVRLILNSCAVTIYQAFQMTDRSGKMGLLKYSTGQFLDNLAALKGVKRSPAIEAMTTLRFVASAAQKKDIVIPAGTRLRSGELFFYTTKDFKIKAGELAAEVPAKCQIPGIIGNGIPAETMTTLVDPINYIKSAYNTEDTVGGADRESDGDLAERIFVAPSGYSVAGPADAYRYWIRTFSQKIGDICIRSESPGEVDIYLLFADGSLPGETFLGELEQYLQSSHIRPLTDRVVVKPVDVVEYEIDVTYYIPKSMELVENSIKESVERACDEYINWQKEKIGRDINPSYLMHLLIQAGAKWAEIRSPTRLAIPEHAIGLSGQIHVSYGGLEDD